MRALTTFFSAAALTTVLATASFASTPSFVVRCMQTGGPVGDDKYGTFYFFLKDGFVKGYACSAPGRPCLIVSQNSQSVVFQTPGETPDTLVIDLRTGAIQKTRTDGLQWTFACKQIPYQP
jgi:hypothetical protein